MAKKFKPQDLKIIGVVDKSGMLHQFIATPKTFLQNLLGYAEPFVYGYLAGLFTAIIFYVWVVD